MIITIDGPCLSGKSTVARLLAKRLGYYYLYSGILYRAIAYLLINEKGYQEQTLHNVKPEDLETIFDDKRLIYRYDDQFKERIFYDGQDITPMLQTSFIATASSIVSTNEHVRNTLTNLQRKIARKFDIIVDGRDTGSVVFPGADFKFYLTASPQVRAERWCNKTIKQDCQEMLKEAIEHITARDRRDQERELAPLIIPKNAIVIDNSELNVEQTLARVLELIDINRK